MKETGYFLTQLDDTIRETEKLLKALNTVKSDCEHISIAFAIDDCMKVVRHAEKTALLARALPVYTYHPRPMALLHQVMEETIPIEIGFTEEGWFYLSMPILLPRKEKSSRNYIRDMIYPSLEKAFIKIPYRVCYEDCVLIFRHVYDRKRPERYYRDHDNIELNSVVDAVALYFMRDDGPTQCRHYYCMAVDDQERTEVFLVPRSEFELWLLREKDLETLGKNLLPMPPKMPENDT